jgi:hypothetical protein
MAMTFEMLMMDSSTRYVTLVKANQELMCFDKFSSVSVRHKCVAHAEFTDTGQSRCRHKCSSKITTVEKLT